MGQRPSLGVLEVPSGPLADHQVDLSPAPSGHPCSPTRPHNSTPGGGGQTGKSNTSSNCQRSQHTWGDSRHVPGPPVCLGRTVVTVYRGHGEKRSSSVGQVPRKGTAGHLARGVGGTQWLATPRAYGCHSTVGPGLGVRAAASVGAGVSRRHARGTWCISLFGQQCPMMSVSTRAVWDQCSSHCGL